jgi:segregation and condensation protein A
VVVVARFLALLELFRESAVVFDQVTPLGELTIRWTGADEGDVTVEGEFDDAAMGEGPPPEPGESDGDAPAPGIDVACDEA